MKNLLKKIANILYVVAIISAATPSQFCMYEREIPKALKK